MIITRVKLNSGKSVRLGGPPSFDRRVMLSLGQFAVATVKRRASGGIGSNDSPMPPLRRGYAVRKTKAGHGNKRDLKFSGDMMSAFSVRYADATQTRMDITTQHGKDAAKGNEKRAPWYGFSTADTAAILNRAKNYWSLAVSGFGLRLRGGGNASRRSGFTNPD